jgi:hypothetical protein
MLFGEKSSGHVNFLTGADSEGGRCRGGGVRGIEADLKKNVYPSLIPCSVQGESCYKRGRSWTRRPMGFFLNTIARGVVSDPAEYFAWRHNSSRCFFLLKNFIRAQTKPFKFLAWRWCWRAFCRNRQCCESVKSFFVYFFLKLHLHHVSKIKVGSVT